MTPRRPSRRAVASLVALAALGATGARPALAGAAVGGVAPPGTMVLVEDGAWSWFEDARVRFTPDGAELHVGAVEGVASATPGRVTLVEVDLASGDRRLVPLGSHLPDDHNSPSIWATDDGEVLTSWSAHHKEAALHHARRRTDGAWLLLPPVPTPERSTYSNLIGSTTATSAPVLYDFYRGERFDPAVLASGDDGRTWVDLGRVLRDPADSTQVRPYVQYRRTGPDRIDLLATEQHPTAGPTGIWHGFIRDGVVHDSHGTALGPLGAAVPVTALTPVWSPPEGGRAWTVDLVGDPQSGQPVVAFSSRVSLSDHRYHLARYEEGTWQAEEIGFAGSALYAGEPDYTGLLAIDPRRPDHVIASADVHPGTGLPAVSPTDGLRHWELWDGERHPSGTWTWTPLTSGSTEDNLRPVLVPGPGDATALTWLRGTYRHYLDYDVDVVGVVRDATGSLVPSGGLTAATPISVLAPSPPPATAGRPIVGDFDDLAVDDLLVVRDGAGPEQLVLGDEKARSTPIAAPAVVGAYVPVPGDFDGDGRTDVFWYAPGPATDRQWRSTGPGTFANVTARSVKGTYTPIPGDYTGDGRTDILWYAPGPTTDHLWTATPTGTFTSTTAPQVTGTYTPIPGDFDGDGRTDVHWYGRGAAVDYWWRSSTGPLSTSSVAPVDL